MRMSLALGLLPWVFHSLLCNVVEEGQHEEGAFVEAIINTFRLISPTIIFYEEAPDICLTKSWVLCLSNFEGSNRTEFAGHLITLYEMTKHDGLIFLTSPHNSELLQQLGKTSPLFFNSDYPTYMPKEYTNLIKLRLDSNVIFYERDADKNVINLLDIYSVKGSPLITLYIGKWHAKNGVTMQMSTYRWTRRTDLKVGMRFDYRKTPLTEMLFHQNTILIP